MKNAFFKSASRATLAMLIALFLSGALFTPQARAASTEEDSPEVFIVRPGNSLWRIARSQCGNPILYTTIKDAKTNAVIKGPSYTIYPKEKLIVPCAMVTFVVTKQSNKVAAKTDGGPDQKRQAPPKTATVAHASLIATFFANRRKELATTVGESHRLLVVAKEIQWHPQWFMTSIGLAALVALLFFVCFRVIDLAADLCNNTAKRFKSWRRKSFPKKERKRGYLDLPRPRKLIAQELIPKMDVPSTVPTNVCIVTKIESASAELPKPIPPEEAWEPSRDLLSSLWTPFKGDPALKPRGPSDETLRIHPVATPSKAS